MAGNKKAKAKTEQAKGKLKEAAGRALGNERMEDEGRMKGARGMPGRPRRRSRTSSSTEACTRRFGCGTGPEISGSRSPDPFRCVTPRRASGGFLADVPLTAGTGGNRAGTARPPCAQEGPLTPEEKGKQGMDIPLRTHATTQDRPAPLRYSRTWGTGVSSIAEARDAVAALLARVRPALGRRPVQDAQIVVSELVTNAAQHAPGPCALRLELLPGASALRVTVTDTSPEPPRRHPPDPRRVGGHGLHLVAMLSRGLEVTWLSRGKRVSATVPLGPAAAD
ncbi:putative regulatory protein [Streptomyces sp. EAS-AB2608]|nr:putative regulatory protein [Streptomyces sp. EAS-AB2608]